MSVINLTAGLAVLQQTWGQKRFDLRFANGDTGAGQSRILAPPRWTTALTAQAELSGASSALWRAMILDLDGQVNQLAVYDLSNPAPQGTMRGTVLLDVAATAGDTAISIRAGAGQAGTTLLRGDWLGIGSGNTRQLVSVAANVTMDTGGYGYIPIKPAVRWSQANFSAVAWDKPTALFRVTSDANTWTAMQTFQGGYSLDLMESWE